MRDCSILLLLQNAVSSFLGGRVLPVGTKTYELYYVCYSDREDFCTVFKVCKPNLLTAFHEQRQIELLQICCGVNGT